MKNLFLLSVLVCLLATGMQAQNNANQPDWVTEMLSAQPNAWRVDQLYRDYYRTNPFVKNYYTQYYKRWRRNVQDNLDANGYVALPPIEDKIRDDQAYADRLASEPRGISGWIHVGPEQVWNSDNEHHNDQTNVYSLALCESSPNIMYSGTEPGEVYKSTNGGINWFCVSNDLNFNGGINALGVDPANGNIVLAGSHSVVKRSADGGATWVDVMASGGLDVREILFNPTNSNIVHIACGGGLYRSTDGGINFAQVFGNSCWDIKYKPGSSSIMYTIRSNDAVKRCEFFTSNDDGLTWNISANGWYNSTDPDRQIGGARIGVTPADPNRVYAYLIGESKLNDIGFIGLFRSDDAAQTWTLPNGPTGGPYTATHPNLARGWDGWDYHQGYYNCAIMVSRTNPDSILTGGLNMWRSDDGGFTFSTVGGYLGNTNFSLHPDMQDFRETSTGTWATSDGGIYHSNDFFNLDEEERTNGVRGTDYWGFGQGWNTSIFGGGAYHNGNTVYNESFPANQLLAVGGGEASSGYANPSSANQMYFSDIGGVNVPDVIGTYSTYSVGLWPNESYWAAESSEMEFHPACSGIIYLGRENKLWKSTDGGASFALLQEFGSSVDARVQHIEIPYDNPDVMYVSQRPASGNTGFLWKTTDGGATWNQITLPGVNSGSRERIILSCDLANSQVLYLAYPSGGNNSKIFKTINGGLTWNNLTTAALNGESIHSISYVSGTDGGIYLFTNRTVFYRNNTLPDWTLNNSGLPSFISCNIAHPFYRDEKIRFASYGKSIWEQPLRDGLNTVIAQPMADKLSYKLWCDETQSAAFQFECHSVLNHAGASWSWTFQNGTPATSTARNPSVVFSTVGTKLVTLTVTDAAGHTDTDSMYVTVEAFSSDAILSENFENGLVAEWRIVNPDNQQTWGVSNAAGGYGTSSNSAKLDNYYYNTSGETDDLVNNFDLTGMSDASLTFDVAYAPYDANYFDELQILVSTDCGANYTQVYSKANTVLATAPVTSNYFTPTASQWRTDTVDLSAYANQADLTIAFRNVNGYGNPLYIDNINLSTTVISSVVPTTPAEVFTVFPNPVKAGQPITVQSSAAGDLSLTLYDSRGRAVWYAQTASGAQVMIPTVFSAGVYTLAIESKNTLAAKRITIGD